SARPDPDSPAPGSSAARYPGPAPIDNLVGESRQRDQHPSAQQECPRPGAPSMNQVTRILAAIEQGDPKASEDLLPLVYDELRRLAARHLAHEQPGQTLQATALVHEA